MSSLKGMLIKRFINIRSQKRSHLKFFDFLESLLKYNSSTMLLSNDDKTDEFFTKCQYRENEKNRNIVTILTKNIIDRHSKFGMLFRTIEYYIFLKYQCKIVIFSKVISNWRF